jgi:DNA-binding response OmpR family regulator
MTDKTRILIVDDEQINLEFFDVMLSKLGFLVGKAENGLEALAAIRASKPDLIILDNVMPKLSGWEVTRLLKTSKEYAEFSDIPIIMFSAMDDVKDKVEGLELGADDYITKPFNFSEVLARIRVALRTRDLIHQIESRESRLRLADGFARDSVDVTARLLATLKGLSSLPGAPGDEARKAVEVVEAWDSRVSTFRREFDQIKHGETELAAIKRILREHAGA